MATTELPVVDDSPVAGDQVYESAPVAVNVVEAPSQMVAPGTFTTGVGFTVTVEAAVPVQPLSVPVTVYTVVVAGSAVTTLPVVDESPVAGDQV